MKVGSVAICGQIYDSIGTVTSGTYERGLKFQPQDNCTFIGFAITTDITLWWAGHTFKLYSGSANPGDAPLVTITPSTTTGGASAPGSLQFIIPASQRVDLVAGQWYRCVIDPVSAITTPRKAAASGAPDATLLSIALPMAGNFCWTEEDTGLWLDASDGSVPLFGPVLAPNTDSAGGGLLVHPGMAGGLRG